MRWDTDQGDLVGPSKNNQGQDITIYKYAGKDSVIYECEQSLKRLRTDYIDLYQIHWNDKTTAIEETFEAVARLRRTKVKYDIAGPYNAATAATDLGAPLIKEADISQTQFTRATVQEMYDSMISDLSEAIPNLPIAGVQEYTPCLRRQLKPC
ncbi:hypothetical protein FQR65_LT17115 [Abscondita terminalis]|nr:hypothetical protein FQR65_LT17115 [Abscondita terminalis]